VIMFALTALAALLWALHFLPSAPLPSDVTDVFGGMAGLRHRRQRHLGWRTHTAQLTHCSGGGPLAPPLTSSSKLQRGPHP
jgi:hypothetical protein